MYNDLDKKYPGLNEDAVFAEVERRVDGGYPLSYDDAWAEVADLVVDGTFRPLLPPTVESATDGFAIDGVAVTARQFVLATFHHVVAHKGRMVVRQG